MNYEERALEAIRVTRAVLERARSDGRVLIYMASTGTDPEDVEEEITNILEYLEKTAEEEKPSG
jgi:hypothetical protein